MPGPTNPSPTNPICRDQKNLAREALDTLVKGEPVGAQVEVEQSAQLAPDGAFMPSHSFELRHPSSITTGIIFATPLRRHTHQTRFLK